MKMVMGIFDVNVNSDHRWGKERAIKLDAYMMIQSEDGGYKTEISQPFASLVIPAGPFDVLDEWITSPDEDRIKMLPPFVQHAYSTVVNAAREAQKLFPVNINTPINPR